MKKCLILFHFYCLGSLLVIILRKFDFESHWNTSIFFDKKYLSKVRLCLVKQCLIYLSFIVLLGFDNKLRNTNFEFFQKSLIFFNLGISCQIKICPGFFCVISIFLHYHVKFWMKNVSIDFKIYWNTLMKIFYLKDNCLLSQNQQVKSYFFDYKRYEALPKYIKVSFSKKRKRRPCLD